MTIGVLALQGAFIEHEKVLQKLGVATKEIRQKKDLEGLDGLIIPGGESTVIGKLMEKLDLKEPLQKMINEGLPVLATCAGLILLAKKLIPEEKAHLQTMPITVKRNAYGRQLSSFITNGNIKEIKNFPMVFIRAPYIVEAPQEGILATLDGHIVAYKYKNQIGLSFHPELTNDSRIHEYFLNLVRKNITSPKK